ncbi:MAG: M13-type metalloendopeptidase, partial [Rhodothermales bacterium]
MRNVILIVLAAILFSACKTRDDAAKEPNGLGLNVALMDTSVRPQDDFFRYANGAWLKSAKIPEDRAYTASFVELRDSAQAQLRDVIESAAAVEDRPIGSDAQKVGDLYASYLDSTRVEELGLAPVEPELKQIESIATTDDLVRFFGEAEIVSILDPIGVTIDQDFKRPNEYMLYLVQSGLGLPDRDYYFDGRFSDVRQTYLAHIERMFNLAGIPDAKSRAKTVFDLETRLATGHWSRAKSRDREATYNKYSLVDAKALMPNFNWDVYLEAMQAGSRDSVVIRQPSYFETLDKAIAEVPLDDWKTYMTFRVLSNAAPLLSKAFVDEDFDFFGRTLNGQPENQPRWKRAVSATNGALGEIVGRMYVEKYFPEDSKARMEAMIANLEKAFGGAIDELAWMTDSTKAQAHAKLEKFRAKVGYPDKWRDYSDLVVEPGDLYGDMKRANAFRHGYDMNKLGKPVDRSEWVMTPQTVNAGYNPPMNDVTFPAAILQTPFFAPNADDAYNYGAIGSAIGHEFSHGFDDQGRKSDGDGALRDWWTKKDATEYERRTEGLVEQYSAYVPVDSLHVNGELTLGENIADLAGLTMAYRAYHLSLHGRKAP